MAANGGWTRPVKMGRRGRSPWGHSIARLWANWHDGQGKGVLSGFITAVIGEGNVLRVTLPVCYKASEKEKGRPSLWLADNVHIVGIWLASRNVYAAAASSLFYEGGEGEDDDDELILLCGKKDGGEWARSHLSVCLTAKLKRVKNLVRALRELCICVFQFCPYSNVKKNLLSVEGCDTFMPPAGLVGCLSGKLFETTWKEEGLGG
ncbi:trans-sialidase [Trypanosoma cruzi]|nr:trans-sialidase [Trypanosoma cruzi]